MVSLMEELWIPDGMTGGFHVLSIIRVAGPYFLIQTNLGRLFEMLWQHNFLL